MYSSFAGMLFFAHSKIMSLTHNIILANYLRQLPPAPTVVPNQRMDNFTPIFVIWDEYS